jgi:hypothetical protein
LSWDFESHRHKSLDLERHWRFLPDFEDTLKDFAGIPEDFADILDYWQDYENFWWKHLEGTCHDLR